MFCPKCGNILPDNSLFCDRCGSSLKQESVQMQQNAQTPTQASFAGSTSTKAKSWLANLNLSTYQKANAIISLCAAIMLMICIDGSLYMWLYLASAVEVLILTVKKFDFRHILSALVPSTFLFSFIITDFVTIAVGQRLQAINVIMQIILAAAVVILWLLCVHPKYKENNKTTAVLMMIVLISLAIIAVFLLISFFINLRYIRWNFRIPFGNLGNSVALVSYVLFLLNEGKTIKWIKEALNTPTVQKQYIYQREQITPDYAPYQPPINSMDDSLVCPACGIHLPEGSLFCDNCGYSLKRTNPVIENDSMDDDRFEQDEHVDVSDTVICPTCGSEVDGDSTFCEYCGAAISFPESIPTVNETSSSNQYNAETAVDTDVENDEELSTAEDYADERNSDTFCEEVVCPNCGNIMPESSEYCERCGEHIALQNSDHNTAESNDAEPETQPYSYAQSPQNQPLETERSYEPAPYPQSVYFEPKPPVNIEQTRPIADERLGFLNQNEILVDEKLSVFKFANSFRVYDLDGNNIGAIQQVDISGGAKAARVLMGKRAKGLQQFHYKILDVNGNQLAAVHRDGGAFAKIRIVDSNENTVGYLGRGKVFSPVDELLCNFKSDWKGWNLTLTDQAGNPIGKVQKKWNGISKEIFTTADKYYISVDPSITGNTRIAIFGMAIVYDILLHEI